jgi:hypothetical protein
VFVYYMFFNFNNIDGETMMVTLKWVVLIVINNSCWLTPIIFII